MKDKSHNEELPMRSKLEMAQDVAEIVECLHRGHRPLAEVLIDDLKHRSLYFEEKIQQDVLAFAGQVYFQYDYDPWHKVTEEVEFTADRLLQDLGI
jgi:hypothetical protein